jgi:hypothetical protein
VLVALFAQHTVLPAKHLALLAWGVLDVNIVMQLADYVVFQIVVATAVGLVIAIVAANHVAAHVAILAIHVIHVIHAAQILNSDCQIVAAVEVQEVAVELEALAVLEETHLVL